MAEIKNAFIKSKMNKDLDARLLPSGEYRDAVNISISKSEGADVGAVENIKGNENVLGNNKIEDIDDLDVIGYFMDEKNNYIYIFSTDSNVAANEKVSIDANCFIHRFDANNNSSQKIVEGSFLNFSKTSFMTGVNLLENLLFFTDNRNQPRVIDVDKASTDLNYYSKETDISVAKIAPYKPISILDREYVTVAANVVDTDTFTVNETEKVIKVGDFVSSGQNSLGIVVSYVSPTVVVDNNVTLNSGDEVVFSRSGMVNKTQELLPGGIQNPNYDEQWEGDTDFIEDKFIRFAYRYKFNDNTYSLISPYTATMFIPKQFGYFLEGDEEKTYKSSIVDFMENFAQEIKLKIPFPSKDPLNDYKIKELDIIYKESDGISLKVLSTLEVNSILESEYVGDDNEYTFIYESKKPYKTLPGSEVTRVYDKVPVKAQSQEVISNRVVYANYIDRNNSVKSIDYYAVAQEKDYARYDNTAQFPYHTLKQSRTYQLGFVLSDIYGRTSSVILSSKDINAGQQGRGSTLFHKYKTSSDNNPVEKPFGDALRIIVEQPIAEQSDGQDSGYPGTYADSTGKFWKIEDTTIASINNNTYTINKDLTSFLSIGDKLKGKYKDYVEITSISYASPNTTIETDNQIADYYAETPNSGQTAITVFGYKINELGWYSYKLVVKQTDQDYYNVYLPGIVNGSFDVSNSNTGQSAVTVLINDNINKVPRDLSEVGPQQKKFRSSVRLFGRVTPETGTASPAYNKQWYPSASSDNVSEIATFGDFGFTDTTTVFDEQSNPLIAKISTIKSGTESIGSLPIGDGNYETFLGVYETVPTETRLELFYETSTAGLISELNKEVANTSVTGATGVVNYSFSLSENSSPFPFDCTDAFTFIDASGTELDENDIQTTPIITSVVNGDGLTLTNNPFSIVQNNPSNPDGTFKIQTTKTFTYVEGSSTANSYTFKIRVNSGGVISNIVLEGALTNSQPTSLSIVDDPIQITTNDTIVLPLQTPGKEVFKNGTSISSEVTEDLIYSITNQSKLQPLQAPTTAFSISANQLVVNSIETSTDEYYTVTIRAEDANGIDENSLFVDRTFNIAVGAVPINYDISDDNGYNLGFGPGCRQTQLDPGVYTYQSAVAFIFGAVGTGDSEQIPDDVVLDDGERLVISREENQGLTNGTLRFKLFTPYQCNDGFWRAEHKVWVQYRQNNTTPWSDAEADDESVPWPSNGRIIYLYQQNQAGFIGDFSTPGEYRVIINPEPSMRQDSPCSEFNGCYNPFYECQLRYCDAVYNDC